MDFMLYAFDPIINEAANWHYMTGGKSSVPVVFWGIINRGGEQAAQHSQALHAMFSHVPGLKVVMPSTPYDAKGLMIAAIRDPNPVVYIDDRWLYSLDEPVPQKPYEVPIGRGVLRKEGRDVTLVAISYMAREANLAAQELSLDGIDVELIDPRTVKPLDIGMILTSVAKTGRLVIADVGWLTCGLAAEIATLVSERAFESLRAPIRRVAIPDCPAPASAVLEEVYYPRKNDIMAAVRQLVRKS
jgi:pyruvate dehydrogenase E1 component beta subunit